MKRAAAISLPIVALVLGVALWLRGCEGPAVEVVSTRLEGPVALVRVRNRGGEGTIAVNVRAGALVATARTPVGAHEEVVVPVRVDGAHGDEAVTATVEYPPR